MKVINLNPICEYHCEVCGNIIKNKKELEIIEGITPLCSISCEINLVCKILNGYSENNLSNLQKLMAITKKDKESKNSLVLRVAMKYHKEVLQGELVPTHTQILK